MEHDDNVINAKLSINTHAHSKQLSDQMASGCVRFIGSLAACALFSLVKMPVDRIGFLVVCIH